MLTAEHRRPLGAFALVAAAAGIILANGLNVASLEVQVGAGATSVIPTRTSPDLVLGQTLRDLPRIPARTPPQRAQEVPDVPTVTVRLESGGPATVVASSPERVSTVVVARSVPRATSSTGASTAAPTVAGTHPVVPPSSDQSPSDQSPSDQSPAQALGAVDNPEKPAAAPTQSGLDPVKGNVKDPVKGNVKDPVKDPVKIWARKPVDRESWRLIAGMRPGRTDHSTGHALHQRGHRDDERPSRSDQPKHSHQPQHGEGAVAQGRPAQTRSAGGRSRGGDTHHDR